MNYDTCLHAVYLFYSCSPNHSICHSLSPAPQLQRPWFSPTIVFYGWECMQVNWESRHRRGQTKKDVTNKNVKTARMVPIQDSSTWGPPSLLLQFDSFLLRAMHKVDQLYQPNGGAWGNSSALPIAAISESSCWGRTTIEAFSEALLYKKSV